MSELEKRSLSEQPTAIVCCVCSVSHSRRELALYFAHTLSEMKQITGRSKIIKALGKECTKFVLGLC